METTTLYAVELRTSDWLRLVTWYRDIVGLRVAVRMTGRQYALLAGREGRLVILGREDAAPADKRWSLVFEVADLETVRGRLDAAGVASTPTESVSENYRELVVADPDGNQVRFFTWPG
jgi:predicted enzyme related to lactoylglutathione lyase